MSKKSQKVTTGGYIYMIVNLINGYCYIGQTTKNVKNRWKCHLWHALKGDSNLKFHQAIRQYGEKNFELRIIAKEVGLDIINYTEEFYISKYDSIRKGYNVSKGGTGGGWNHSEETKLGISRTLRGREFSKEHREALGKASKASWAKLSPKERSEKAKKLAEGRSYEWTDEMRLAASERMKGDKRNLGKRHGPLSRFHKQAISKANSHPKSDQTKSNMKLGWAFRNELKKSLSGINLSPVLVGNN